ncbi:MAG: DUF2023 family protein [Verrucomicrobiota bacterium]
MTVFTHHIYEYKKGLRNLVLHTMPGEEREWARRTLERKGIAYQMYPLDSGAVNVFFGATDCVEVVRAIGKPSLSDYTPEEDFILGTMLGYDRLLQCRRYLRYRQGAQAFIPPRGRTDRPEEAPSAPPLLEDECPHEPPSRTAAARYEASRPPAAGRSAPDAPRLAAPEHTCSRDGEETCIGCLTGNPCAACRARMKETSALAEAVNE